MSRLAKDATDKKLFCFRCLGNHGLLFLTVERTSDADVSGCDVALIIEFY